MQILTLFYYFQKGRNRKCSIVQEEEDDEEVEEPASPLNRRGSRSEGRINKAVQDRLAAEVAEMIKKEQTFKSEVENKAKVQIGLIGRISGIKIIKNDNKEIFLGQAGIGARKDTRSSSVDKVPTRAQSDIKFLTESSTVSIPSMKHLIGSSSSQVSKPYKTMPSPSRQVDISSTSNCLKEIVEDCDAGSSDNNSNSNTPRPILRSQANRRTKFQKSRTTSGSSSDEDNTEKKRATKTIAIAKQFTQRRDSHDDSSDSQDPGTNCSGNSNAAGNSIIFSNRSNSNKPTSQAGERNNDNNGKTTSNSIETVGFRKHRTGRRRQTETRLRESQSLNRITEVQECELSSNYVVAHFDKAEKLRDESSKGDGIRGLNTKVATLNHLNTKQTLETILNATNELKDNKNHNNSKAKGFGARFLQNLNFRRHQYTSHTDVGANTHESFLEVPFSKVSSTETQNNQMPIDVELRANGSDRSKKIKSLGRFFQVKLIPSNEKYFSLISLKQLNKKVICHPLSSFFRHSESARLSSNLYKAQSCSSIIRDGVHLPHTNTLSTSSSSISKNFTNFDKTMLKDRECIIKNCLKSRFISSDSNINRGKTLENKKEHSLLDYIEDDRLCASKC